MATEREMVFIVGSPVNCRLRPTGILLDAVAESRDPSRNQVQAKGSWLGGSKLRSGFPFVQLNTDLEKKLLEVASLELADRGGVTGVIWEARRGHRLRLYLAFRGRSGGPGNPVGAESGYSLILALGIALPGLILPLPKSGL